jgi:hypothetical protein
MPPHPPGGPVTAGCLRSRYDGQYQYHHGEIIMTSRRNFVLAFAAAAVAGPVFAQRATLATVYLNPT